MKVNFIAVISGTIFGFGLCLSEMINPAVVIGFLDVTGDWNPALLFVMIGALLVTGIAFRFILRCAKPFCAGNFTLPQKTQLDTPLIFGAVLFGIGWGLAGICPGPAIAALALGVPKAVVFVFALIAGTGLYRWWEQK